MEKEIQRSFYIGDEWIYFKLYSGYRTSELLLLQLIKPLTQELLSENIIDKWFFIRYADPEHHLRLRLHSKSKSDILQIMNRFNPVIKAYSEIDLIWKVQVETYERELDRYGDQTIGLTEEFFFHESEMIVDFLGVIGGEEAEELRWLFGLRAIKNLLNAFQLADREKCYLLSVLRLSFASEFNMSRDLKKQLDVKYRRFRQKIETFMDLNCEPNSEYFPLLQILGARDIASKRIIEEILNRSKQNLLQMDLNSLLSSYIHMLMNRLFKSQARVHEMVCYDFLTRHYTSKIAQELRKP